jgi:uncharacterized protein YwqG
MKRTTPPPRKNVLEILPRLAGRAKTTVRLHPRRGRVSGLRMTKVGGAILWPRDESWPTCDEAGHYKDSEDDEPYPPATAVSLVPVFQLRAQDFPDLEFFPKTDLLQLLWCPLGHRPPVYVAKPFVFWRKGSQVKNALRSMPRSELASDWYRVRECRVHPERVVEYPTFDDLTDAMQDRLDDWDVSDMLDKSIDSSVQFYEWELSACPGNKVGGYPHFIQRDETPRCRCRRTMEHLLTLTDCEFDAGTHHRWCPSEDKRIWKRNDDNRTEAIVNPLGLDGFAGGCQYLFICRSCENWPIKSVYQR